MTEPLPKRKSLRLPDFDYASGAAYFITVCTHLRQPLFGRIDAENVDDAPRLFPAPNAPDEMIVRWLRMLEKKYPSISLDMYTVMPEHIHFILFQSGAPLQDVLRWLKTQTTNEYIRGVKAGLYLPFHQHLWQRSYYEHIIRNELDLMETRKYIENNPARRWQKQNAR